MFVISKIYYLKIYVYVENIIVYMYEYYIDIK